MSLRSLLRNAALGISLTVGCGSSENKFDRAFDQAQEQLEQQGIEVRGGLWNRERDYTLLFREMRRELGDLEAAVARRNGSGSCDEAGLSEYDQSVFYCGPAAVQGNCDRLYPGDCLNQVCYEHDRCYNELLDQEKQLCLWSEQTGNCDETFFREYDRCTDDDNCGFYCQIIGVIAVHLSSIEYAFNSLDQGCLWEGDYETPQKKKEPKDKENKDNTNLIDLCVEWHWRNYIDCMSPPDPNSYELLTKRDCTSENIGSIKNNRQRLECAYEKNCGSFSDCLDKNAVSD